MDQRHDAALDRDEFRRGEEVDTAGARKVDLDKDGRKDLGYYAPDGTLRGAGFDENHDGRVDVFKKYGPDGKVIEETRDTDHDGVLDQRSTDTDGDGKFDKVVPYPSR